MLENAQRAGPVIAQFGFNRSDPLIPDHTGVMRWLELIQAEYREIPGLRLTRSQVQRLWGLDDQTCETLLNTLERTRFLRRTTRDAYVRADVA